MSSYRDLDIYRISFDLSIRVHRMSLNLPKYELYEEGSQVRRASKGISANIVEGYGRSRYKGDFIKYLVYAHASCDETILHLEIIKATHEQENAELELLLEAYNELGGKLNKFIQYVEREWR